MFRPLGQSSRPATGSIGAQDYSRVAALVALSDLDLLKALDLLTHADELTAGALLLFGTEEALARYLPAYEVAFQELDGLEVRANEIGRTPLNRAMIELADRVKARNPEEEVEIGLLRIPLPRFADVAIRELIANALVHRDYTANGPTLVEISRDALIVSNPGGLPEGVTISNLLTTPPRPRNPALADSFKRAGLVDAATAQLPAARPQNSANSCPNEPAVSCGAYAIKASSISSATNAPPAT